MTANERSALASLLSLRVTTREKAEQTLVAARKASSAARSALASARDRLAEYRDRSNAELDQARSSARTGADFVGVDSLGRAIREETRRLAERIAKAETDVEAADRAVQAAIGGLARAEADERAVGQRVEAAAARERAVALARADDDADELAAGRAARGSR